MSKTQAKDGRRVGMRLGCSSLTTKLHSELQIGRVDAGYRTSGHLPSIRTISSTIRWVSDSGINSMGYQVLNEEHLEMLALPENARQLSSASAEYSTYIDYIACDFISRWAFADVPEGVVERSWSKIGRLAEALGAHTIESVTTPVPPLLPSPSESQTVEAVVSSDFSWERLWKRYAASIKRYSRLAKRHDVRIAIEPRPREFLSNTDALLRLLDAVGDENVGGVVDVSHVHILKEAPALSILKLGRRIFSVHLSDNDGVTESHWPPGQGKVDWSSALRALRRVGYDEPLSLDVIGISVERELIEGKTFIQGLL